MKRKITLWLSFTVLLLGGSLSRVFAQCPGDMTIYTDSGACTATINFTEPSFPGILDTVIFQHIPSGQMWIVPAGVDTVEIHAWGAQGNYNSGGVVGGLGGYATGWLPVTPGDTLMVFVGSGPAPGGSAGYNGGGFGGTTLNCPASGGAGGGGASDVRDATGTLGARYIVAGGGGGAGGNRNQGCGRGAGGGGGGGYYGGGGGAGWPSASLVVPTGGTQTAGGSGGTSTYTGAAPQNNGFPGVLGIGGTGGEEIGSNQSGSGAAQPGGVGGGTNGGDGSYVTSYTGQSGAGGSGYIGGVVNGSMSSGVRTGNGEVWFVYHQPAATTQISGVVPGDTSGVDTLVQSYEVDYGSYLDTCTFMIYVLDNQAPTAVCQSETLDVGSTGTASATLGIDGGSFDNCGVTMWTTWSDTFTCADVDSMRMGWLAVWDNSGNSDTCAAMIFVEDQTPPLANCKNLTVTLGPNGTVTIQPGQVDNGSSDVCGVASLSVTPDFFNGQDIGSNLVTLTVTDNSGNISTCNSGVTVVDSFLTGVTEAGPNGIQFEAFPNPTSGNFTVRISCPDCSYGEPLRLKLISLHGTLVLDREVNLINGEFNFDLNLSEKAAGQYLLMLSGDNFNQTRHIIKM
ncbi:MAG: hypothetical protein H6581_04560 [Bacteroidia bacterium]|nr:hypothetical protein [Bacteroidia bacterium]